MYVGNATGLQTLKDMSVDETPPAAEKKSRGCCNFVCTSRTIQAIGSTIGGIREGLFSRIRQRTMKYSDIPVLEFDQPTLLNYEKVSKLKVKDATRLSEHPFYRDSFFRCTYYEHGFEVTRCRLDPLPPSDAEPVETIVERLMPEDCHFRVADIRAIGNRSLGLRHVSSHECAAKEKEQGMHGGCSLNISFSYALGTYENEYYNFHKETEEEIERRLPQYESAIDTFIYRSILRFDLKAPDKDGGGTLQHLLDSAKKTAFMVLNYDQFGGLGTPHPKETDCYVGLGRFAADFVSSENVTLLKNLDVDNWDITDVSRKQYDYQFENVVRLLVAQYRKTLLGHVRTLDIE